MSCETVLLVDDSKVVQAYFSKLMTPPEFKLLIASNTKEAKYRYLNTTVSQK